jgi:hypothetical protein
MVRGLQLVDGMSVQDRDLLTRLTQYFDTLESRLAQGQGWFIFNASGPRAAWLGRFIQARLAEYRPLVSSFVMPWRDFALNAYMTEVELPARAESEAAIGPATQGHLQHEYQIATGVSRATGFQMRQCDVLVVMGVRPTQRHEAVLLDEVVVQRHARRRATLLLTPHQPHDLATALSTVESTIPLWDRLWSSMYERSLVAL